MVRAVARRVFAVNIDIVMMGRTQQYVSDGQASLLPIRCPSLAHAPCRVQGGESLEEHVTFRITVLSDQA